MRFLLLTLALLPLAAAQAVPPVSPPLRVWDATIPATMEGADNPVKMIIHNPTPQPVVITNVTSPMATKMALQHYIRDNGFLQVYTLPRLEIPAGHDIALAPLGLELRLLGATRNLTPGLEVPLTFTFADGTTRTVRLTIERTTK